MTSTQSADEFFCCVKSVFFRDDNGDEDDENLFQQPEEETSPKLCPHCNLYILQDSKYQNKAVKYCIKDGYLCPIPTCYSKLPKQTRNTVAAILRCSKGHEL